MTNNNNNQNPVEGRQEFNDVSDVEALFQQTNAGNVQAGAVQEEVSQHADYPSNEESDIQGIVSGGGAIPAELLAHVICKVEENEAGGVDMVYQADNIENNVTGVVVLDMFRGYVLSGIQRQVVRDALASPLDVMLAMQDKVITAYQTVKGSQENRCPIQLESDTYVPYIETVKPKDGCYQGMVVNGSFEDIGTMIAVLMARYVEQTHIKQGMEAPETFQLFNPTGSQESTLMAMPERSPAHIRANQWQTVFSRL